jgi:hypothetical protein
MDLKKVVLRKEQAKFEKEDVEEVDGGRKRKKEGN